MKTMTYLLFAGVLCVSGIATIAALGQDTTRAPGEPTQARVWVQNRGASEAVPVAIQAMPANAPLRVQVAGTPTVTMDPVIVLRTRPARGPWEYRAISIPSGQDGVALLNTAGAEGWETTGVALASPTGTIVIMKQPR